MFLPTFSRDIMLFLRAPKEFLFSFTYPTNTYVTIKPYDPKVTDMGKDIIKEIHKVYPELIVHLLGSTALEIAGQRDIDLIAECSASDFNRYLPGLVKLFGEPEKTHTLFVEWSFTKSDCDIQFLLIDPKAPLYKKMIKTNKKLASSKKLAKAYEKVKLEANGVSVREYARRRLEFFVSIGM